MEKTRTVKRLYDAGVAREHRLAAHEGGVRPHLPSFLSVRSMLWSARSRDVPPTPESVESVVIEGAWGETWNGENLRILTMTGDMRSLLLRKTSRPLDDVGRSTWMGHFVLVLSPAAKYS
ncbi:hypothetical protein ElyMa_000785200 [Elysia marginata]|uniref:Uncharacterized protein n=1 Tax=Elysia marginata TaxID=1093978 RepID=A0AAV4GWR3_9GAST|nr:hypothetical protein ElyMa_000785200 [Elysia marginata]